MYKRIAMLLVMILILSVVFCSCKGVDPANNDASGEEVPSVSSLLPNASFSEETAITSLTETAPADIDMTLWTVIRIMDPSDFSNISYAESVEELKSLPALSEEYYKLSERSGYIDSLEYDGQVCSYPDGFLRIDDDNEKPLFCSILDLCSDLDKLRIRLGLLGINDKPRDVGILTAFGYPLVLFVECDDSIRLITIDDEDDFLDRSMEHLDEYVLRIYSPTEFRDRFGLKNCSVYVNGEPAPNCRVVILGDTEEISLMTVLASIDASAELIIGVNSVDLRFMESNYTVSLDDCTITAVGDRPNETAIPPGSSFRCFVRNGDIVVDMYAFTRMLKGLNISANKTLEHNSYRIDVCTADW